VHRGERIAGWGRAGRNPSDPTVPKIGGELATARALSDALKGPFALLPTADEL